MRLVNALAYDLFTKNPGIHFSKDAIEAYTEIKGAGGASAIVNKLRTECKLSIVKISRDKITSYFLDATVPFTEPDCILAHYAGRRKSRTVEPKVVTEIVIAGVPFGIDLDAIAAEVAAPAATSEPEVAPKKKRIRPSRAKKPVRELEMHE